MISSNTHEFDKCLIDNWSLERAAYLLETEDIDSYLNSNSLINAIAGLSNFINAVLLYDDVKFMANGYQTSWYSFPWFKQNAVLYVKPFIPVEDEIFYTWLNRLKTPDYGASYYLTISKLLKADLFLSTERASKILSEGSLNSNTEITKILSEIDRAIHLESQKSWLSNIQIGIEKNFILPSLTHYVFSQASTRSDLLTVIMQLKSSGVIDNLKLKLKECSADLKDSSKFQLEVENIIKKHLGYNIKSDNSWSIKLNILFLTLTKSLNLQVLKQNSYITFLKDIIACRTEVMGLKKDIDRIFAHEIKSQ